VINFNKLAGIEMDVVPVLNNQFVYNRKHYSIITEDGWYMVHLQGNEVIKFSPDFPKYIIGNVMHGYTYNNSFLPENFDVLKKKYGYEIMVDLQFNNLPTMSAVDVIIWEDNKFYFYQQNFSNMIIFDIQNCIDEEGNININDKKGLTPEIKTVLLFHSIERKQQIALKKKLEEKKKIEEYQKSMPGRLMLSFKEVGAEILKYSMQGKNLIVDWKLKDSYQAYNSVIDAETFRIKEAGFCLSGFDKDHNVKSIALLAKGYEEEDLIHITRRN
jgi:hypothetical protein